MNKKSTIIFIMSATLCIHTAAMAGAWVQPKGNIFLRLAGKYYQADSIFDADGDTVSGDWWDPEARFREFAFNLIAEAGLLDQLTLTFENTAKFMHSDYSRGKGGRIDVNGLSDMVLGVRYGPYQKNLVLAFEAKLEIPTGYEKHDDRVRLGPGYANAQAKILFGGGLPLGIKNYFDSALGYRIRGGPFSDDLTASASFGVETMERLWVRIGSSGVFNLGDSDQNVTGQVDGSYLGAGIALTYLFHHGLGLELAASKDMWGKNTFAGWAVELVVQYQGSVFGPDK